MRAPPSLAVLFPGQGSQYPGMGKALAQAHAVARRAFEEASDALGFDVAKLCGEGDEAALRVTTAAQPTILAVSVACYRVLVSELAPRVDWLAGHSLGEYTALVASGVYTLADAARLVRRRAELMLACAPEGSGMLAVRDVDANRLEAAVRAVGLTVFVACVNSPRQLVYSGAAAALDEAARVASTLGGKAVRLKVSSSFHCDLLRAAADGLRPHLLAAPTAGFAVPVVANLTAKPYDATAELAASLYWQVVRPVQWHATVETIAASGVTAYLEVSPGNALTNLVREIVPGAAAASFDRAGGLGGVESFLKEAGCGFGTKLRRPEPHPGVALISAALRVAAGEPSAPGAAPLGPVCDRLRSLLESLEASPAAWNAAMEADVRAALATVAAAKGLSVADVEAFAGRAGA